MFDFSLPWPFILLHWIRKPGNSGCLLFLGHAGMAQTICEPWKLGPKWQSVPKSPVQARFFLARLIFAGSMTKHLTPESKFGASDIVTDPGLSRSCSKSSLSSHKSYLLQLSGQVKTFNSLVPPEPLIRAEHHRTHEFIYFLVLPHSTSWRSTQHVRPSISLLQRSTMQLEEYRSAPASEKTSEFCFFLLLLLSHAQLWCRERETLIRGDAYNRASRQASPFISST